MDIYELLAIAKEKRASDLHLSVDSAPLIRVDGKLTRVANADTLTITDLEVAFMQVTTMEKLEKFQKERELDFQHVLPDGTNLRCSAAQERGQLSLAFRILPPVVPTLDELQLPEIYKRLSQLERGLIIISGPIGSGKTTTQAAIIEYINTNQTRHIVSFEDPIEYSHRNINSKIIQRELGGDTLSFSQVLKHSLRHDPDVIVVGEMRDTETAAAVISLAETGHLVISTSHASNAAQAVERIVDLFPHNERSLEQMRLASLLTAVFCQILVPRASGSGRIAAVEIMLVNTAIKNLIREGKITLISDAIRDYGQGSNTTIDESLCKLYREGFISINTVKKYCHDPEEVNRLTSNLFGRMKELVYETQSLGERR
jgi:twitching motility protein PilT